MNTNNSRRDFIRNSTVLAVATMVSTRCTLGNAPPEKFAPLPDDRWPGRLIVGDKTLDDFVAIKEDASADASWTARVFQSVSVPELQIRAQWRTIGAVTEWIPTLVNNSPTSSGKVSEVRSLAAVWPTRGRVDFYGNKGSFHRNDDFLDHIERDIDLLELAPVGGRSSDGILPFFALSDRHDSLAVGIGWSGQWSAALRHSDKTLQVEVGLPNVGFVLRPWESVRLPSVLLAWTPGASAEQARRVVRSHLTQHVIPRAADGTSLNFTAHSTMYHFLHGTPVSNEESEIKALERAAALGVETWWVDASWFGDDVVLPREAWIDEIGNWYVRSSDFPRGLRPISDRAHDLGMKFLFWMEPEHAVADTEWARAYPDLFLGYPGDKREPWLGGLVLNLGNPRAVDLAFEKISSLITEFNADVYRQDMNTRPLEAWYAADAPDRVGITEIRHIEGLYALWDRILAAHPGIVIDNCSSGGRRIDLETLRRSVPLWRSDYLMDKEPPELDISNQIQGWGLGQWVADHLSVIKTFDAYAVRSTLATGIMPYRALPENAQDSEYADAHAAIAENKRLRPLICEERIGLIAPILDKEAWSAFQHHRRSDASGIIVALRGPGADTDSVTLRPEHIDVRGTYQVIRWDDYVASSPVNISGADFKELVVTIAQTRSSVLVEYQQVAG